MDKLTTEQLLFLDNLIYLHFSGAINNTDDGKELTLLNLIKYVLNNITNCTKGVPASMTAEQWVNLLESFTYEKDESGNYKTDSNGKKIIKEENEYFLENYVVENYVTDDTDEDGFRASCFVNKNDKTDVVVVFRGSYGGTEWEDNLLIANDIWSEHMDKGVNYINEYLPEEEYGNNITVTGHSKGGNRAQYVTIVTDRIGRCVSFDGQGFSQEFLDYYEDVIEEKKSKITSICAEYDYINALLIPIAGTSILLFRK